MNARRIIATASVVGVLGGLWSAGCATDASTGDFSDASADVASESTQQDHAANDATRDAAPDALPDVQELPDAPQNDAPVLVDANGVDGSDGRTPEGGDDAGQCIAPDAGPDAACFALFDECTCPSECCAGPGVTCSKVGALVTTRCCVRSGNPCTQDSDCCGNLFCKPAGDAGDAGTTCQ